MALTVTQAGGQYVVNGITRGTGVSAPLGRQYFQVGAHYVGFDDNFAEPVIVRAYYDPTQDIAARRAVARGMLEWIGYMQFMRLSFRGTPIPPDVYGGRLADRTPYVVKDGDQRFLDFMGPAQARLREITAPFYPYNAMLVTATSDNSKFFSHPLPNGSLWSPDTLDALGASQSMAASLFGEVCVGLVTAADLEPYLSDGNLVLRLSPSAQDLAGNEAYQLAWNYLTTTPLPTAPAAGPPLAGLDKSQVAAQLIGDYVLLTLPDPENLGDTLAVSTSPRTGGTGGTDVLVHLLSDYDMEGLFAQAGREALWRIRDYQLGSGTVDSEDLPDAAPSGLGRSGLYTPPFAFTPSEFILELRYWTVAVAVIKTLEGTLRSLALSGFSWAAMFQFDEDTGSLAFTAVRQPEFVGGFNLSPPLRAFRTAMTQAAGASIDTSNFTLAAMRRDNFAAGSKLSFVDGSGRALT